MNSEQMINSIYNPKKKQREPFIFPKISKGEPAPQNKVFVRGASRKYNQQNIFKIEDEKRQRAKIHIEQQRMRELRNRECEQLQQKMAEMTRRHNDQMREIEQAEKLINAQIEAAKKEQYQHKLGLWELKNQIMTLNSTYLEEQNQYKRLYNEVGYVDGEEEDQEQYEQNQEEDQDPLEEQENVEGLCLEGGEQGEQVQPRDASRAITLQMQQLQISSQLQLQEESHSVM